MHEKIEAMIKGNRTEELREFVDGFHPSVAVEIFESLSSELTASVLRMLDPHKGAELFSFLPEEKQDALAREMPEANLVKLITYLSHDERVDLLARLPDTTKEVILDKLANEEERDIRKLYGYDEGTIGALMTSDFASLSPGMTASEAIAHLREKAHDLETIYYGYVLDDESRPAGVVSLKDLIVSPPDSKVEDFMTRHLITVHTRDDDEKLVQVLGRSDLIALPVIDRQGKMVGIVTHDDIADVAVEESTEDFHRLGATGALPITNIRQANAWQLVSKRIPWLLILVGVNVFSGMGIAYHEDTLTAMISLAFFLPLLIDSGGNAGSQASTLMVRALAIGDVRTRDWLYFLRKEIAVSLIIGLLMGAAVAVVATFRSPEIIAIVSLTMLSTVLVGSLIGTLLPFILTKLKFDPANASAPLITSICDISGVLIYFSIAAWMLGLGPEPPVCETCGQILSE